MGIQTTTQKASNLTGTSAPMKKSGYAEGGPPAVLIGSKPGKIPGRGYSGPNVAIPSKDF